MSISESKVVKEGYFGMNSYVLYRLETKVLPLPILITSLVEAPGL